MEETYKQIRPEDIFITFFDREATEAELWQGIPLHFEGNRPSGNNFLDLFARLVRRYGRKDISVFAKRMGVETGDLISAIRAISGLSARDWMNGYSLLAAKELLEKTDWQIGEISRKLGFTQLCVFSKFFQVKTGMQAWEWRVNARGGGNWKRRTYHVSK